MNSGCRSGCAHTGAADRPLPYVQTNLAPPNEYADQGGQFPGDSATVSLRYGKYTWVNDSCGKNYCQMKALAAFRYFLSNESSRNTPA